MQQVKIIIAMIDKININDEEILSQIAPYYANKYKKIKIERTAKQELVTGYLLKKYLNVTNDEQIRYGEHQKPYLVSNSSFFNVSHSGDYVVLAISDGEVGIDVERARKYHELTAKKVFSESEFQHLQEQDAKSRDKEFTKMWTECEAKLKLWGTGFATELHEIKEDTREYYISSLQYQEYVISWATEKQAEATVIEVEQI